MTAFELPTKPAAAYDLCREMFGIGTFDDAINTEPYWKARTQEIGRLNSVLKRRRVTPEQIGQACWYAQENRIPITYLSELIAVVDRAVRAWNRAEMAERHERALADISDVIQEAQDAGEITFVGQLLRADRTEAVRLIEQWREKRP